MREPIGYAVVGLGDTAHQALLSAFTRTGAIRLTAVVAPDRGRAQTLAQESRASAYSTEEFRQCLQRGDVNAVYLALPNSMHCDFAVEAARAGVHVLCEKSMAVTADECRRMIRTCQTHRVKLMIATREPARAAMDKALELVRGGAIGPLKTLSADLTLRIEHPADVRLQRRLGGGTLYDLGISAINAARRFFGTEPAQVMAMTSRTSRRYGGDVDEGAVALIRFPDERLAHFHTSFGEQPDTSYTLFGETGLLRLRRDVEGDRQFSVVVVSETGHEEFRFEAADPLAEELTSFARSILEDRAAEPSGLEGLQDVRLVEAIYRSARDGRPVTLPRSARPDLPAVEARGGLADRQIAS
jgi:glucose-fructose oxidoreductase